MVLGLLVSAVVLFRLGLSDALRALTFAGRVMGAVFLVSAVVEVVAAGAVYFWGRRVTRYAGQAVLLGVSIVTVTSLVLLVLQWEGGYLAGWFWLWTGLVAWAVWAVWMVAREKVWQGVPHPRRFATGVALSALIGSASVTYSAMYVPYVAPPKVPFMVSFGKPVLNPDKKRLYVPAHVTFRNEGSVSIFVIGTLWAAQLWPSAFRAQGTERNEWLQELGDGWDTNRQEEFNTAPRLLAAGQISNAGARLDPGDDFSKDAVVEVPLEAGQGRVELSASVSFIRADRCKLANSYKGSIERSWNADSPRQEHVRDAPVWLAEKGDDYFRYQSRIYRSSEVMRMKQAPDWASMWWVIPKGNDAIPVMQVHISRHPDAREVLSENEQEPYGMKTLNQIVDQPVAVLRRAAGA